MGVKSQLLALGEGMQDGSGEGRDLGLVVGQVISHFLEQYLPVFLIGRGFQGLEPGLLSGDVQMAEEVGGLHLSPTGAPGPNKKPWRDRLQLPCGRNVLSLKGPHGRAAAHFLGLGALSLVWSPWPRGGHFLMSRLEIWAPDPA